jgi:hypothetical protein
MGIVALVAIGMPVAIYLDLRSVTDDMLRKQVNETGTVFQTFHAYYSRNVASRMAESKKVPVTDNFRNVESAIPLPATLAIEVGGEVRERIPGIEYRFASDYPFRNRPKLDEFERTALASLRRTPNRPVSEISGSLFERHARLARPVLMERDCVACHNAHPDSPKRDWKVGDVRGIHEIILRASIADGITSFPSILIYLVLIFVPGVFYLAWMRGRSTS